MKLRLHPLDTEMPYHEVECSDTPNVVIFDGTAYSLRGKSYEVPGSHAEPHYDYHYTSHTILDPTPNQDLVNALAKIQELEERLADNKESRNMLEEQLEWYAARSDERVMKHVTININLG